ncbi:hypothetical protein M2146_002715 [Lachnospiraceae bacterium PF1-22]|uniref:DUF3795 domain-containing protein n=1 Tax=Ohessyouella blattaphilus TaxID=2949333 RepID=UPI003E1E4D0D
MEYRQREYPLFSACGLNCGLCPRYQMDGASKCPGCSGEGFLTKHPTCGVLSCSQRKGLEYCYQCDEYPCKKYNGADQSDSFITHLHQFKDMEKAKELGIDVYRNELDEKVAILETLLTNYDDGRRKGFFCLAVNLLELQDVRSAMEQIACEVQPGQSTKEKADIVVRLFRNMAGQREVILKLRRKETVE